MIKKFLKKCLRNLCESSTLQLHQQLHYNIFINFSANFLVSKLKKYFIKNEFLQKV